MNDDFKIDLDLAPDSCRRYDLHIARLPDGTQVNINILLYQGSRPGPVLMVSGGLHGDEVNGIEIVRRLMASGDIHPQAGTVIAVPILNIYGFLNFDRELPDGKDANRSFPGVKLGSLASRVAWHVSKKLLPLVDYGIDFHTGGGRRSNYPQTRCDFSDPASYRLAEMFGAPFLVHSALIPGSLRNEAHSQGKPLVVYEAGQSLSFDEEAILAGMRGVGRVMFGLGMHARPILEPEGEPLRTIPLVRTVWVRAENAGLFHPKAKEGRPVVEGDLLGALTDPYNEYHLEINAPLSGYVIGLNNSPVVNAGDALVHLGSAEGRPEPSEAAREAPL